MKRIILAAACLGLASPAFAQAAPNVTDSVKLIIANGAIYEIMGENYDLSYKADGTYTQPGDSGGKWKAEGKKMCHTPTTIGQESCNEVPDGKKSGDVFNADSTAFGPMKVTIK